MKYILLLTACILTFSACYEDEPYWLDENIKEGGTYYPLLQAFTIEPVSDSFPQPGGEVEMTAQFWSRDEVKQLEFYRVIDEDTEEEIATVDYDPVFDEESEAFLQSITHTLPNLSDTTLTYKAVVRTVHDLIRESEADVRIE